MFVHPCGTSVLLFSICLCSPLVHIRSYLFAFIPAHSYLSLLTLLSFAHISASTRTLSRKYPHNVFDSVQENTNCVLLDVEVRCDDKFSDACGKTSETVRG